jgi:hypothetical protein
MGSTTSTKTQTLRNHFSALIHKPNNNMPKLVYQATGQEVKYNDSITLGDGRQVLIKEFPRDTKGKITCRVGDHVFEVTPAEIRATYVEADGLRGEATKINTGADPAAGLPQEDNSGEAKKAHSTNLTADNPASAKVGGGEGNEQKVPFAADPKKASEASTSVASKPQSK